GPWARPVGGARQQRICFGPVSGRRDDALRQQWHRAMARFRATARKALGIDADHAAADDVNQTSSVALATGHEVPRSGGFQREADLERYLIVTDLAVLNVAARLDHFKPIHIADGLVGLRDRRGNRVLDARLGRTYEFEHLVNMVFH